ncbi:hypothetical protein [Methylobacterium sp. AMS5]|uniref:hypothetical protein n=1 Tax=Methylobacterium sp. AMS5 TaxID=925818 RepID=UPI00074F8364|nr:hypothetical protein [Methylobacterium sp. AMS5]AMB48351.1 hypothetical protein Y590_25620 [Methylobacterium sp. AMS5]
MKIPILANDPSFTHWGMARMLLDLDTLELELTGLRLIVTKKNPNKTVRVTADDLVRSQKLSTAFLQEAAGVSAIFTEVPSGAQDAKSSRAFGIVVGILASSPIPVTQIMPLETKAVVKPYASKGEMIEAMVAKYPHADWLRARGKATGPLIADNEHLADAIAVAEAGVLTDEFRRSLAMMRGSFRMAA